MSDVPSGWEWRDVDDEFPRWQLSARDGMMLGIVERPYLEFRELGLTIPVGWLWRNSWGGSDGGWAPTLATAMAKAEEGAGCG